MAWTDKMVEDLKIMWKQGLTTGEIGKRLGVSKNSIVGKVHRLQLEARPSPIKKKEEVENNVQPKSATAEPAKAQEPKKDKKVTKTEPKAETKNKIEVQPKPEVTVIKPAAAEKKIVVEEKKEPEKPKPAPVSAPVKTFVSKPAAPAKTYNGNAKLTDLDNHTCRWPIGDPKDENFHFCGRKVRMGQTYCEEHAALAYVKPTKK